MSDIPLAIKNPDTQKFEMLNNISSNIDLIKNSIMNGIFTNTKKYEEAQFRVLGKVEEKVKKSRKSSFTDSYSSTFEKNLNKFEDGIKSITERINKDEVVFLKSFFNGIGNANRLNITQFRKSLDSLNSDQRQVIQDLFSKVDETSKEYNKSNFAVLKSTIGSLKIERKTFYEKHEKLSEVINTTQKNLVDSFAGNLKLLTEPIEALTGFNPLKKLSDSLSLKEKQNPTKKDLAKTQAGQAILWQENQKTKGKEKGKEGGFLGSLLGGLGLGGAGMLAKTLPLAGAIGAIAIGLIWAAVDAIRGVFSAKKWGTSKVSAGIGGALGGLSSGIEGAFKNMGKWALIGAGIGTLALPGIGTLAGGLIGAAIGGILGFIGGKNLAKAFDFIGNFFNETFINPIKNFFGKGKKAFQKGFKKDKNFATNLGSGVGNLLKFLGTSLLDLFKSKGNWTFKLALGGALLGPAGILGGGLIGMGIDFITFAFKKTNKNKQQSSGLGKMISDFTKKSGDIIFNFLIKSFDFVGDFLNGLTGGKIKGLIDFTKDILMMPIKIIQKSFDWVFDFFESKDKGKFMKDTIESLKNSVLGFFGGIFEFFDYAGNAIKREGFIGGIKEILQGEGFQTYKVARKTTEQFRDYSLEDLQKVLNSVEKEKTKSDAEKLLKEQIESLVKELQNKAIGQTNNTQINTVHTKFDPNTLKNIHNTIETFQYRMKQ